MVESCHSTMIRPRKWWFPKKKIQKGSGAGATWQVAKEQLRSGMPLGISVVKMCADFVKSYNAEATILEHHMLGGPKGSVAAWPFSRSPLVSN